MWPWLAAVRMVVTSYVNVDKSLAAQLIYSLLVPERHVLVIIQLNVFLSAGVLKKNAKLALQHGFSSSKQKPVTFVNI